MREKEGEETERGGWWLGRSGSLAVLLAEKKGKSLLLFPLGVFTILMPHSIAFDGDALSLILALMPAPDGVERASA